MTGVILNSNLNGLLREVWNCDYLPSKVLKKRKKKGISARQGHEKSGKKISQSSRSGLERKVTFF